MSRLWLRFSHLNEHKFCHNFKDALRPICDCGSETEIDLLKTDPSLRNLKDELLLDIILYGSDKYNDIVNKEILLHTISFIKNTKRFERPVFDN